MTDKNQYFSNNKVQTNKTKKFLQHSVMDYCIEQQYPPLLFMFLVLFGSEVEYFQI